jgi:copper(I)-binding protein
MLSAVMTVACSPPPATPLAVERAVFTPGDSVVPPSLYFTVHNAGGTAVTLTGVRIDAADSATIHTTTAHRLPGAPLTAGPMAMYTRVDSVIVAAGQTLRFAPGGYFVMTKPLTRALQRGDSVRFTIFATGPVGVTAMARVLPYAELDVALASTGAGGSMATMAPTVAMGRELYLDNGCASCHGRDGHGDGPVATTLVPPPRDFRSTTPYRNGSDVASVAQTLATGIPNGGQMPLFAHLTDGERRALALYVISLRQPQPQDSSP